MVTGPFLQSDWDILPVQVVQTRFDVGVVIVDLVLIECRLGIEGVECLLKLHKLSLSPLSVAPLVSNVLSIKRRIALSWHLL